MLSINTNAASFIAQRSLKNANQILNKAVERMSTGFKINHASDNAANYSISTNMTTKIGAYQVAEDNVAMGLDLVTTASESLELINDKLMRLRALAEQAANGTYGERSLSAINAEANALVDEIERTHANTEYSGVGLFGKADTFIQEVVEQDTSGLMSVKEAIESGTFDPGKYSISSAEELQMISKEFNASDSPLIFGYEFILANDLDLSGYTENGGWKPVNLSCSDFDGNGHTIYNLYIDRNENNQSLFRDASLVKNLRVENANIRGGNDSAVLLSFSMATSLENCCVTGNVVSSGNAAGLGSEIGDINNCWSSVNITSSNDAGGLACSCNSITNSYATGNVKTTGGKFARAGGLASNGCPNPINNSYFNGTISAKEGTKGGLVASSYADIKNCYVLCEDSDLDYLFGPDGTVTDCYYSPFYEGSTLADGLSASSYSGKNPFGWQNDSINHLLQVGIDAGSASQISLDTCFLLDAVGSLREIGASNGNYLLTIDSMINKVSAKQTEFGACQNRLESALEEISTQYENLVSSRSTLRDADVAHVSSEYIRQQILQQASATLMATANQAPALALQLL